MKVLVTGANGFVGLAVLQRLNVMSGLQAVGSVRRAAGLTGTTVIEVGDLAAQTDWTMTLAGADAVVHLAARVHVMHDTATDPLTAFRAVNVAGTLNLARQAATAGVKRFVFISSVKVNGEGTLPGRAFAETDAPNPLDAYGRSKYEAEQGLRQISAYTGMEVVIIRPPLVYGPGVKANFAALMRALPRGVPLPFGAVHHPGKFVALDNLVDFNVT